MGKQKKGFEDINLNIDIDIEDLKQEQKNEKEKKILLLRIDKTLKDEFQKEITKAFFIYKLDFSKQTSTYMLSLLVHNMSENYLDKYKSILDLNDNDIAFYSNKNTKGRNLPPNVYLNTPINYSIITTTEVLEGYKKLMNTYYKNELAKLGISRYSNAFFFYEMVDFLKSNLNNLKII